MRITGILAIICVVFSFLLSTGSWIGWTFFSRAIIEAGTVFSTVLSVVGFTANLLELLGILLIAIGLVLGARRPTEK